MLDKLQSQLESKKAELSSAETQLREASLIVSRCDDALKPLGARKNSKSPDVVREVQSQIDALRAQKDPFKATCNKMKAKIRELTQEISNLEKQVEKAQSLINQQAERDAIANRQDNAHGKTRNRQRDIRR